MNRKKMTVYDYLQSKGKQQLSVLFVHNVDEAEAAEEAGIDMICTSHDAPQYGITTTFEELKDFGIYGSLIVSCIFLVSFFLYPSILNEIISNISIF